MEPPTLCASSSAGCSKHSPYSVLPTHFRGGQVCKEGEARGRAAAWSCWELGSSLSPSSTLTTPPQPRAKGHSAPMTLLGQCRSSRWMSQHLPFKYLQWILQTHSKSLSLPHTYFINTSLFSWVPWQQCHPHPSVPASVSMSSAAGAPARDRVLRPHWGEVGR